MRCLRMKNKAGRCENIKSFTMVSTRGVKHRFSEGERVLCYEPDPTKAKVLYDSKVLGVEETKDKRGKKILQYKIHFQGWNSSWDRRVNSDYVLKDTEENRQLQRDLAQKAQLQLAAYLYRRERKKRVRKENTSDTSPKSRNRVSSEDGSSCSTFERNESEYNTRDDCDTESCSSSIESMHDEDRVLLKVGERLKNYLEYDYEMIVKCNKQHILPARISAVTILENFVKQSAIKLIFCSSQTEAIRRRSTQLRPDKKDKGMEKVENTFALLKEVADGLRIYFDFTLTDYLLYKEEKEQAATILSEENLHNFSYVASDRLSFDFLQSKYESSDTPASGDPSENQTSNTSNDTIHLEESRRRLRSYRNDESEVLVDLGFSSHKQEGFSSIASTSSGGSTPHANVASSALPFYSPTNLGIPSKTKEYFQEIISWQILPSDAAAESSMIYGAVHLARLLVKLPDFLNATTITDEKLKILLQHLDSFILYLESHKEWFGEHNYYKESPQKTPPQTTEEKIISD